MNTTFVLEVELSPSATVPTVVGGECSAARPAADGTEPQDHGPENGRGEVADLAAECSSCRREHQPRDRAVQCLMCSALTFEFHAICARCHAGDLL